MSVNVKELKKDEFYIVENNPRHPPNPNGLVLKYKYAKEMLEYYKGTMLYVFEIIMIPNVENDPIKERFKIGEKYSIIKSELNFLRKL